MKEIDERNTICWTAMISRYTSNGRSDQALRSLAWIQLGVVSVPTVVPFCGELKVVKCKKEIHAYVVKNHFFPNVCIALSLMMMYSKCGVFRYSWRLFKAIEGKKN